MWSVATRRLGAYRLQGRRNERTKNGYSKQPGVTGRNGSFFFPYGVSFRARLLWLYPRASEARWPGASARSAREVEPVGAAIGLPPRIIKSTSNDHLMSSSGSSRPPDPDRPRPGILQDDVRHWRSKLLRAASGGRERSRASLHFCMSTKHRSDVSPALILDTGRATLAIREQSGSDRPSVARRPGRPRRAVAQTSAIPPSDRRAPRRARRIGAGWPISRLPSGARVGVIGLLRSTGRLRVSGRPRCTRYEKATRLTSS